MAKTFIREKKIYCGTEYLEVDCFQYTEAQKIAAKSVRGRKEKITPPKQNEVNDKNARRYLIQLGNANFGWGDLHVTATYHPDHLPESPQEAERVVSNFFRRVNYRRKKEGLPPTKYILVTEYSTGKETDGEKPVRIHHHIIMSGGLDRDVVESLWCKRRKKGQKQGDQIGYINADRLQPDDNGIAALCTYLTKNPNRKKRWSSSQNLVKPYYRTNDSRYSRRKIEQIAKNPPDVTFWEKQYPNYTLAGGDYSFRSEYHDQTGWSIYIKLRRIKR